MRRRSPGSWVLRLAAKLNLSEVDWRLVCVILAARRWIEDFQRRAFGRCALAALVAGGPPRSLWLGTKEWMSLLFLKRTWRLRAQTAFFMIGG
eukprot:2353114-Pyramimonas_sp.AAC.1